ncbi:MAG: hypothetical protein JXA11_04250 [Phycisphaerae bacterium]|nr:hypothetical protein [Phycisphaerae bacterium]
MKKRTIKRGSVLVMVVGLLTIIAMLGSVFLLVSRMHRRTADALDAVAPDSLVMGIVEQIAAQMKADLNIGEYNSAGADESEKNLPYYGGTDVNAYADYPGDGTDQDTWLSTNYSQSVADNKVWPYITNISGETSDIKNVSTDNKKLKDTDADGIKDAIQYRMEVFNANGDEYCASVRVIDLAGLLCVNTAGVTDGSAYPSFLAPVKINLYGLLGDALYNKINNARFDKSEDPKDDMNALWENLASHPSSPGTDYKSYGVGDEMYVRWLTDNEFSTTYTGTLYEATKTGDGSPMPVINRRYITTQSCSRNLLRKPRRYLNTRIPLQETTNGSINFMALSDDDPDAADKRTALYNLLVDALDIANPDDARMKAAHIVANLWAYMDGQKSDKAYKFEVTDHSDATDPFVYGLVPQPFIVEAYAYNLQETATGSDHGWAFSVELYNPSTNTINLDGKYKIVQGTNEHVFSSGEIAANGGRFVIYTFGGQFESSGRMGASDSDYGFDAIPESKKYKWDDLDFTDSEPVRLVRIPLGNDPGDPKIEMDSVSKNDIGYTTSDKQLDLTLLVDARRDDSNNKRYALNRWAKWPVNGATGTAVINHTLGNSNNYSSWTSPQSNEIPIGSYYCGFSILESRPNGAANVTELSSVADLMKLFLVGPHSRTSENNSLVQNLWNFRTNASRAYINDLSATVTKTGSSYPDGISIGEVLGELFAVIPGYNPSSDPVDSRVYGRLNLNTATKETLLMLPWPDKVNNIDLTAEQKGAIVDKILENRPYSTPGKLANVLGEYFDNNYTATESAADYLEKRGELYQSVANLVSVNSDVYGVTIRVGLEDSTGVLKHSWNYISVIDRSNCFKPSDTPSILLPPDQVK